MHEVEFQTYHNRLKHDVHFLWVERKDAAHDNSTGGWGK